MSQLKRVLAVDLGASSGRVIAGAYDGEGIAMEEIHRFPNIPVTLGGHLHWNVLELFRQITQGIKLACRRYPDLLSVSVDTWGVDYGILDSEGQLLYTPHHYRDRRMHAVRAQLEMLLPPEEQFRLSGNQPDPINTVYQLFADWQSNETLRSAAGRILLMPDLFHYFLSGAAAAERTILSTSGLLAAGKAEAAREVSARLGLPADLLPDIVEAGTVVGTLRPDLCGELGCPPLGVIAGASHDTAAAVAAVPYRRKENAAFISCGTWSLVGLETEQPVLSEACYSQGFTNESCFGGGNRLLKNITGLWLLQETQRTWAEAGEVMSFAELTELAEREPSPGILIDPGDPLFAPPGDMPARIGEYCLRTGQTVPESRGAVVRVIVESLARAYSGAVAALETLTGRRVDTVHMVGGGIRNKLLCQLTADACGKEVVAGPVEASALGNMLVQLAALGELDPAQIREIVASSETLEVYQPGQGGSGPASIKQDVEGTTHG
ncbi:rhamnulokinase ['Paenibacillus yunnanensis' Narsing Rao et al. 2020]|uniref:rhamnulokinase n=1 Tax=Paenibacillus tengchongensis TaxID=2608684 RepID=UPI00124E5C94|nr:rhamnulokinase family protein [Paenibacillus tengchongensis]